MDSTKKYDLHNPKQSASVLSKLFFCWTLPLFKKGYGNDLDQKDLYNTLQDDHSEPLGNLLETNWNIEQSISKKTGRKPRLLKAISKTFIYSYSFFGVLLLIQSCIVKIAQPVILGYFINYFSPSSQVEQGHAYGYASALVILSLVSILIMHQCSFYTQIIGMRCRIACCSLIYRKLLRLSRSSLRQTTAGQIINLLSNDVNRFDLTPVYLHYVWIMPIQVSVSAFFMYQSVGISALVGILIITLQAVPLQGYLSRMMAVLRMKIAQRTDDRVKLMNEIIAGIQVIKMYAWEAPFEKLVQLARKYEIDVLAITSYIRGISLACMVFTERLVLYGTLVTYVLLGNQLTGDKVFSIAQFINNVQLYMAIFFPIAIALFGEARISVKRIENFLLQEENPKCIHDNLIRNHKVQGEVTVKKIKASWTPHPITDTLSNLTVSISPGSLCAVVGPVGAGKSSFLQLLLGELLPHTGTVNISGTISYAAQDPWLFVSSVRNNILFGQPYDKERYKEIVNVCALEKDFKQFLYGDKTLVGERGVSLSGGQRARINLARAIYRRADIYLLDDPLSAVDAHVSSHLFNQCIMGYLQNKTRILVTHQIHFLQRADVIILISNGHIEKIGTYEDVKNDLAYVAPDNNETDDDEKPRELEAVRKRLLSVHSETSTNAEDDQEEPQETQELMEKGAMSSSVYLQYLKSGGTWRFLIFFLICLLTSQVANSGADYWVTYWTNQEEMRISFNETREVNYGLVEEISTAATEVTEAYSTTDITDSFFNETTTDSTNTSDSTLIADSLILSENNSSEINIQNATDNPRRVNITYEMYTRLYSTELSIYIYTVCILGSVLLTILRALVFFKLSMNASRNLHDTMFNNILQATMKFFDTNPSGRILNRFSKDMGAVDELLPRATMEAIQIFLVMCGILIMVLLVNLWMIIPMLILGSMFYFIRVVYLATAQDIKRLEGTTKSPVFSHVTASMDGITTIRASGAQLLLQKEFDIHQDGHTKTWFLIVATSCAFGFFLDVISVVFLFIVTFSFLLLDIDQTSSGNVGLAISQSLILTGMLQYGMRQTAEVVNQMTSVERVLQYTKLDKEGPFESDPNKKPKKDWPKDGQVEFKNLYLRYLPDVPVLKNLNVIIRSGQKVGIVGRTGAGKSSIIAALFRLTPIEGNIIIDGIDTQTIGLHDLRSRISIIPQEPVLFSSTVRQNLDPFQQSTDAALWQALEEVELKDAVTDLDFSVSEGGLNFSVGQRQLICLARAIIRNNKVLVLDEATANVDPHTDSLIQTTIRSKFADRTVLTIAHRLNTIMDSDQVLVLDAGQILEYGHPHILLQDANGFFTNMLRNLGHHMENNLRNVAKVAYESLPRDLSDLDLELIDQ